MLNRSIFDVVKGAFPKRVLCVVCSVYYTRITNREKRYNPDKKIKNSEEVPSSLIFSKTDSSLLALKNINNYLRKTRMKFWFFGGGLSFFLENGKNTLHTTHYTLHTIFRNGVKCEI